MATGRVLIVDDEKNIRDLCARILSSRDYETAAASGGKEALERLSKEEYDLLLIDLMMPEMDGLAVIHSLREQKIDIPSVLFTAFSTLENALRAIKIGVKEFVMKPFTSEELLSAVGGALERHRVAKESLRLQLLFPLFEISRDFLAEVSLRPLLSKIVSVARKETRSDTVSLMLIDEPTQEMRIEAAVGLPELIVQSARKKVGERLAGWVAAQKTPLLLQKESAKDAWIWEAMKKEEIASAISVPLISSKKVIGVLNVSRKIGSGPYHDSDVEFLSVLCGQAAIAIENAKLFGQIRAKEGELRAANFDSIKALAEALESKDAYTRGHSDRAEEFALAVGEMVGIAPERMEYLRYAAILHDIGKIGVPDAILNKPASLIPKEYDIMKTHPEKGAEIVRQIKYLAPVVPLVQHHHENWDGSGYPLGVSGEAIPLESRIVAVLDAYDAMTSDRCYRKAPGLKFALEELRRFSGTQFDPRVVEAFLKVVEKGP